MHFVVIGGSGKVALKFASLATAKKHTVTSITRSDGHFPSITSTGARPHLLSLESSTAVSDLTTLFSSEHPDCIVFSAGAGGKGGEERTKAVDYEGALKVFDAAEASNCHRLIMVSATDLRDTSKPAPEWYNEDSKALSERMYKAIPAYMKYKRMADQDLYRRKALRFTIVRPGGLTDEPSSGVELGKPQLGRISRESVGKIVLACAENKGTEGMVFDCMDGEQEDVDKAVEEVVKSGVSTWHD